jgi:DNA polymerase V
MEKQAKSTHGGSRPGSGRPRGEATRFMRVPEGLLPAVRTLVDARKHRVVAMLPSPKATPLKLPLFGHRVKAGFPSPADDYIEAWLDLNDHLIEHKGATFFVTASGDSMTGAGIQEGNLLVVDRAVEARDGDIVIAVVDGELTIKRLEKRRGKIRLIAENPAYSPIEFKDGQELTIWGVVTSVIQKIKR